MLVDYPAVDWLRITTFDEAERNKFVEAQTSLHEDKKVVKQMQYEGYLVSNTFVGHAIQNGKDHYMLNSSGDESHQVFELLQDVGKCTRIDLQITVKAPEGYSAREWYDELLSLHWGATRGRPKIAVIVNDDGLDTIYIGSRQSMRFTRIYVKPDEHDQHWLRLETEYKGDMARQVFASENIAEILAGEFDRIPVCESVGWKAFRFAFFQ